MREREVSPVESYVLRPGIAWYGGLQARDNDVTDPPPAEYLCSVPTMAPKRARWAARIGNVRAEDQDITVLYFVDPEDRRLFAQPHPDTAASTKRDWGLTAPHAQWPFELARETARWIFKVSRKTTNRHEAWWRRYVAGSIRGAPPVPFALPVNPAQAYRGQGWSDFKDWLVKPRDKQRKLRPLRNASREASGGLLRQARR
jgi:hypothetical protein